MNNIEHSFYSDVYDILVSMGGAGEWDRLSFIESHAGDNKYPCREWRFCGKFGFGGKYRSQTNTIDYYREHRTDALDSLEAQINTKLQEVYATYKERGMKFECYPKFW